MELAIIENLKQLQEKHSHHDEESDEDGLFARQIAATLRRFTYQQKAVAKVRIQQVLMDIEFGSPYDTSMYMSN